MLSKNHEEYELNKKVCISLGIEEKGCSIPCEHVYLGKENCIGCSDYGYPYVLTDKHLMEKYNENIISSR